MAEEFVEVVRKARNRLEVQRIMEMFGCSLQDMKDEMDNSAAFFRGPMGASFARCALVVSVLSDAQELMSLGELNRARQYINRAKWIIDLYLKDNDAVP